MSKFCQIFEEETRRYHEEKERIIDGFSKELQFQGRNHKEIINSDHRKYEMLTRYIEITTLLKECYEDKLGLRKKEIQSMSAPNEFTEFYERLTEIKDYHKRNPDEIVGPLSIEFDKIAKIRDNAEEASAPIINFTDEEGYGKFLDMHECFQIYINLKGIKAVDYVTYLNTFDKLYEFPKDKKNAAYLAYLQHMKYYLENFLAKAKPMLEYTNIEERNKMEIDFNKQWSEGKCKGWQREAGSALSSQSSAHLDLSAFNSWEELASLGCDRLKSALMALNVKCGGTLEERAQRLWSTKGQSNEELQKLKRIMKKGANKGCNMKEEQKREMAFLEAQIYYTMDILKEERLATVENVQRKQARTIGEMEDEEESEDEPEVVHEVDETDESTAIYNPKNLPLDWDGKPIPYWLYKLHGLNMFFTCEICGNETYRGPKAFQQHFSEWRHAHGMRCLGIPNTPQFANITKINEAIALWSKINTNKAELQHRMDEEEYEDSQGNVIPKRIFDDLKRQGLL